MSEGIRQLGVVVLLSAHLVCPWLLSGCSAAEDSTTFVPVELDPEPSQVVDSLFVSSAFSETREYTFRDLRHYARNEQALRLVAALESGDDRELIDSIVSVAKADYLIPVILIDGCAPFLDSAIHYFKNLHDTVGLAEAMMCAYPQFRTGDYKPFVIPTVREALRLATLISDKSLMAEAAFRLGKALTDFDLKPNNMNVAREYLHLANSLFVELQNEYRRPLVLERIGWSFLFETSGSYDPDSALHYFDQAEAECARLGMSEERADVLTDRPYARPSHSSIGLNMADFREATRIYDSLGMVNGVTGTWTRAEWLCSGQGLYDSAIECVAERRRVYASGDWESFMSPDPGDCAQMAALIFAAGDTSAAYDTCDALLARASKSGHEWAVRQSWYDLGSNLHHLGAYEKALEYLVPYLEFERADTSYGSAFLWAQTIAECYLHLDSCDLAREYIEYAVREWDPEMDHWQFSTPAIAVLARSLSCLGYHDSAYAVMDSALAYFDNAPPMRPHVDVMIRAGELRLLAGDAEDASKWFDSALAVSSRMRGVGHPAVTRMSIGGVYRDAGDAETAREFFETALQRYRDLKWVGEAEALATKLAKL